MRKWIIGGVVVLLVLVIVAGVVLVSLNGLIDRNKQYILAQVKEAVGRDVTVGDIGVSLWGGVGARLKQFSVADDPAFAKEPFVRAEDQNHKVKACVGPLGAKAEANNLPLEGDLDLDTVPLANLEKTVPGLKRRYPQGLELAGAIGGKTHFSGSLGKDVLPQINGALNLAGVSARIPQLPQPISDVNAKINFTGKTAELPETAFHIGKSEIRLAAKVASFAPLNLTYRVSSPELGLADLRAPTAGQKKPEILKNLTSEGTVLVKDGALTYRGNLSSPEGTIADGDYTNLQTSTSFVNRVATIESMSVSAFGGSLTAKGNYDMRESTPCFAATTNVKAMDLTQIFRAVRP